MCTRDSSRETIMNEANALTQLQFGALGCMLSCSRMRIKHN